MSLVERREHLLQKINTVEDEHTLEMLEETLEFYTQSDNKDIVDGLDEKQLAELNELMSEPVDKDTITEEEFLKIFDRWNTK